MIVSFVEINMVLFDAFLAEDGTVRKDHPLWPKFQTEVLNTTNVGRRFLRRAMRHVGFPRAALSALLLADPDLHQTLRHEMLPANDQRPYSLPVFTLAQPIAGLDAQCGDQFFEIDTVRISSLENTAAVARALQAALTADELRREFSMTIFSPAKHRSLITPQVYCRVLSYLVIFFHNIFYTPCSRQFYLYTCIWPSSCGRIQS
jgi:hypothetical protein